MKKIRYYLILLLLPLSILTAQTHKSNKDVKGLAVGTKAPLFKAKDASGNTFSLAKAIAQKPVVLIFYRGQWCPVCNRHLSNLQDSLQLIYDKGATVIAVSPQKPDYIKKTVEKTGATFTLLYDKHYKIANAYHVTFLPNAIQRLFHKTLVKAQLSKANTDGSQQLPIPATYIIDENGMITWRQFNPNFKKRASVKAIVAHLP